MQKLFQDQNSKKIHFFPFFFLSIFFPSEFLSGFFLLEIHSWLFAWTIKKRVLDVYYTREIISAVLHLFCGFEQLIAAVIYFKPCKHGAIYRKNVRKSDTLLRLILQNATRFFRNAKRVENTS